MTLEMKSGPSFISTSPVLGFSTPASQAQTALQQQVSQTTLGTPPVAGMTSDGQPTVNGMTEAQIDAVYNNNLAAQAAIDAWDPATGPYTGPEPIITP